VWSGNGLRVSVSESLVLKTWSDRIGGYGQNQLWWTQIRIRKFLICRTKALWRFLRDIGYVSRMNVCHTNWATGTCSNEHLDAWDLLLEKNKEHSFLKKMITPGESKDSYPQTATKAGLHPKKMMLCIWWDIEGIVYYELLSEKPSIPPNTASNLTVWRRSFSRSIQNLPSW